MFKTELHCHSSEASPCSTESAESLVEIYTKAGYDTVILTNHYSPCVFDLYKCKDIGEYVDIFMQAFKKMKEVAKDKLTVLCGAEIRFNCNANDYLWFGDFEDFMRKTPEIFDYTPESFHEVCKQNGWLFIQAHPFRNGITVTKPDFLDGVEVYNGHIGHPERNFIAMQWAEEYGLIKTSGTDLHYSYVPATGGILTEEKITTIEQLVEILKSGKYSLLKSDKVR
ncbi:MAG: hypothetical protein IKA99_01520 [Clostridia bacterium]|nr:hypothetical protein [Clostridia bacterium]